MINMNSKKKYVFLLVTLFSLAMMANSSSNASATSSTDPVVFGTLVDAFYGDLDHNNDTYDIQYNITVTISNFQDSNKVNGYYLTLVEGLEYPDGSSCWYQFNLVSYVQTFNLKVIWYNYVTQSGWYTAHSYSYSTYGHDKAFYSFIEFDPPSAGVTGSPPD